MAELLALRHVAFEDLGAFAPAFERAGHTLRYIEAGVDDLAMLDPLAPDVLVILGGPIGAYEDNRYPWLTDEIALIARRIAANRPTMGICLGSQLIARAAGARVYPSGVKEIGFAPIKLTPTGRASCLGSFQADPLTLHWHGDTFDLPAGAELLASTDAVTHQAYSLGPNIIAFQFHPEAGGPGFERWLIGHTGELTAAGIDVTALRDDARRHAPALAAKADTVVSRWLANLKP